MCNEINRKQRFNNSFKDTHEAIIDRKTFVMVRRHFAGRKRPDKQGEMDMRDKCIREFIRKAKEYIEMPKLTLELLRVFIRRIEVLRSSRNTPERRVIPSAYTTPSDFPNRKASLQSKSPHSQQQKLHKK